MGLAGCLISGVCILLAALTLDSPSLSLTLLRIGRVISWNGIATYGAMAIGAPLGVLIYQAGGLLWLSEVIIAICLVGIAGALPRPAVKGSKARPLPFRAVLGKIAGFGTILAMESAGFGGYRHLYYTVLLG